MTKRVTYALAGLMALAAGAASAQSSKYQSGNYTTQSPNGYYYDACKREQTGRGTVGAVLGGGAGAVIGSNVAARNARTEGALLGGLLGAIAGGVVGNKSAACTSDPQAARRLADGSDGIRVVDDAGIRQDDELLVVRALVPALDELVASLVRSGVAVRELAPVVSPLEAAFLALTEQEQEAGR